MWWGVRKLARVLSLPARGAWIEMCYFCVEVPQDVSLPARGAWIEINMRQQE